MSMAAMVSSGTPKERNRVRKAAAAEEETAGVKANEGGIQRYVWLGKLRKTRAAGVRRSGRKHPRILVFSLVGSVLASKAPPKAP
jgi:hypothetical protein